MSEYLAPGVFVEETSFRHKSIEGVGTSVASLVGPTRTGPLRGTPEAVTSYAEFERIYGDLSNLTFGDKGSQTNYTALAARAFFDNGGKQLFVARTVNKVNDSDEQGDGSSAARTSKASADGTVIFCSLVEVDSQEAAAVVFEQRIHTDGVLAGQMVVDRRIGQRDQQAVGAVTAFDARLLAHPSKPFIGTGRGVARFARGLAFPANRIDIGAPTERPAEQGHLLGGRQTRRFRLSHHDSGRLRQSPIDAVGFEQRYQAGVFGLKGGND